VHRFCPNATLKIGQTSTSASTWNEPCRPLKPAGQTIRMLPEASREQVPPPHLGLLDMNDVYGETRTASAIWSYRGLAGNLDALRMLAAS